MEGLVILGIIFGLPVFLFWLLIASAVKHGTKGARTLEGVWCPDPYDPSQLRWWDGYKWTQITRKV